MRIVLKNRVNSGNAKPRNGQANPEPSQGYILGRCRDYRRGSILLITGIERPTSLEKLILKMHIWRLTGICKTGGRGIVASGPSYSVSDLTPYLLAASQSANKFYMHLMNIIHRKGIKSILFKDDDIVQAL